MCVHLSGFVFEDGEIYLSPHIERHELLWTEWTQRREQKHVAAAIREKLLSRAVPGADPREGVWSWEYPLARGVFSDDSKVIWNALDNPQQLVPDASWWRADAARLARDHIAQIVGTPERLFDYMTSNDVVPTGEHYRCIIAAGYLEAFAISGDGTIPIKVPYYSGDWYQLWPDPASRTEVWRTEEEKMSLATVA